MNADEFLSRYWYDSLRMAGKNPSMLRFFNRDDVSKLDCGERL